MTMPKVVILCGGRGKRLQPLTRTMPKPLVLLNGKPVLQHIVNFYIHKGFHEFIFCVGFRADAIARFVKSSRFDADIKLSNAGLNAGMLERIYKARHLIGDCAIVTYGDTFIDIEPYSILKVHRKSGALVTITTADISSPFGLVSSDRRNLITSFEEKPVLQYYIGHMVVERNTLEGLSKELVSLPDGEGLIGLFQQLIKTKKLSAYNHKGLRITFNTPREYKKAEEEFIKFFTEQEG